MVLVAVYDKKAESFGQIYTEKNVAVAVRNFSEVCTNKDTNLYKFPEDYELYLMGNYDEEKGEIKVVQKVSIATAETFSNKNEKKEINND